MFLAGFCLLMVTLPIAAQTAHPGATIPVVSGMVAPMGVAVNRSGDVFFSDDLDGTVKEIGAINGVVSLNSTVTTVGTGFVLPNDVAVDSSGNVFVADFGNDAIKEILAVNGVVSSSSTVNTVHSGFPRTLWRSSGR